MKKTVLVVIILLALVNLVQAQTQSEASQLLDLAEADIKEMADAGFNTTRVNDILIEARQIFDAQKALEERGGTADYSIVADRTAKISDIKEMAFYVNDEINALEMRISELEAEGVELDEAKEKLAEVKGEFYTERYEIAEGLIDDVYKKISEAQALTTKLKAFYEAGSKTIGRFFEVYWKEVSVITLIVLVVIIVSKNRITMHKIKKKIRELELEKEIINDLIKKAQSDYFTKGVMSEATFHVKTSKFGEILRDIDRQMPLLKAELKERKKPLFFKGEVLRKKEGD